MWTGPCSALSWPFPQLIVHKSCMFPGGFILELEKEGGEFDREMEFGAWKGGEEIQNRMELHLSPT